MLSDAELVYTTSASESEMEMFDSGLESAADDGEVMEVMP